MSATPTVLPFVFLTRKFVLDKVGGFLGLRRGGNKQPRIRFPSCWWAGGSGDGSRVDSNPVWLVETDQGAADERRYEA